MAKLSVNDHYKEYKGEIEFVYKDRAGNVVRRHVEPNIVKIYAKETLAHRISHSKVWDPNADSGTGAWVASPVDPNEDFAVKYILFGASFDDNGVPLDTDDARFYQIDPITQIPVPLRLQPGADYDGGLINAVPLAEPDRPLKRIENIAFEATYQPAGTPQLQDDVRPMNNIVLLETTLRQDEYNGFGLSGTNGDFFTISEVALVAGRELDAVGACECDPKKLFLEGDDGGIALPATTNGTDTITLDATTADLDLIEEGDSIKIVALGGTAAGEDTLDQVSPFYLVVGKIPGGRDIQLDRVPSDSNQTPLSGQVGVFKNTMRIFSHRILSTPVKKTSDFEILVRWRIIFN
tara:strand:- start:9108 stop:10157 length:1050 start_codon:yes stop_codon:yes gene_type:complete